MQASETASPQSTPKVINPLWIISLFLGLSETTTGIAAIQASGWVQGLFAVAAVAFPLIVSSAFFVIIWKKPEVLYAPGDYPEHVPVPDFVHGVHRSTASSLEAIGPVVRDTLESVLPQILNAHLPAIEATKVVSEAVATAQVTLKRRSIKIDLRPLSGDLGVVEWVVNDSTRVFELLDSLWSDKLEAHVPIHTYGDQWVLLDPIGRRTFGEMGYLWSYRTMQGKPLAHLRGSYAVTRDDRLLSEVGITPGMELIAAHTIEVHKYLEQQSMDGRRVHR